ncbi:MAG: hypothetical protein C4K60_19765 [Ideonella sp. MAG2]|nr:MAG: hypothetical protein C4K60_19765 [Ideonella sp. MAG2]
MRPISSRPQATGSGIALVHRLHVFRGLLLHDLEAEAKVLIGLEIDRSPLAGLLHHRGYSRGLSALQDAIPATEAYEPVCIHIDG